MQKILSLIITSIILFNVGYSQTCGTEVSQRQMQYMDKTKVQRENYSVYKSVGAKMPLTQVPVQIHMTRTTAGTGGLTAAQITSLINDMNVYYANSNMEFFQCSATNYIDNDTYYDYDSADETALAGPNDVANVINIYFFNSIVSGASALCGYSRFPPSVDRIFMANSCATNGSTMTHEMGHFFSLYHTHGKSNTGTTDELVNGTNCTILGDDLCDTPADPNLSGLVNGSCGYTGTGTDGNGDTFVPDPTNVMSYSLKACRTNLSTGQYNRVAFSLANDRNYLTCATMPGYCVSNATSTIDTEIDNVTFNTINQSSASNCTGYTDYTAVSTNVTLGQSYTLSISTGDCNGGTVYARGYNAYIDWNGDLDYDDAGEMVFSQASTNTILSGSTSITIPLTATIGSTEMRIVTTEGGVSGPCGTYTYGETEDYTINIGAAPTANFSASATTVSLGQSVTFTDLSTNTPTGWNWSFTGGTPISSTTQNPIITYNTAGTYNVSLTSTNAFGNDIETKTLYITVSSACASNATSSIDTDIDNVTFNTINQSSTGICATYTDYTSVSTSVTIGSNYTLSITTGDCNGGTVYDRGIGAYIDWNGDGDYVDAGEQVILQASSSTLTASTSVTIPGTAVAGATTMRIITTEGGVTGPCGTYTYGETEDYTINILANSCATAITTFPYNEDFESFSTCTPGAACTLSSGWTNETAGDDMDWTTHEGGTTSNGTGPGDLTGTPTDFNPGTATGNYLYTEATGAGFPSKVAIITTPCFDLTSVTNTELVFAYNMYGAAMGTLNVEVSTNAGASYTNVWNLSGDQGDVWTQTTVDLSAYDGQTIKIRFRGVTGSNFTSDMAIDDVTIQQNLPPSCTPTYTFAPNGSADGDYIDAVVLGTINNTGTGGIAGPDYNNYTAMSTNITQSQGYTINVTNGTWATDNIAIWIDYNQDGDYMDAGEKLGEQATTVAPQTLNFNFTVPAGASLGATTMRVRLAFGNAPLDPCATYTYGEVEDYTVVIQPACSLPVPSTTSNSRCGTGTVNLSASPGAGGTTCNWYAAATGGAILNAGTTFTTPSISVTTTYYVSTFDGTCESTTRTAVMATVNSLPTVSFSGLGASYCIDAGAVILSGSPAGGTFSGPGMTGNSFTPSAAGTGPKTITYSYTDGNSCSNTSNQNVTVNALPSVSFSGLANTYCSNDANVTLSGSPGGGSFSGSGISGTTFSPSSAAIGSSTITYSYTDGNSCTNSTNQSVTVNSAPTANFTGLGGSYCSNDPAVTLNGTPAGGTFSGGGISGNTFTPSSTSGNQTISYSVTVNGCTDTYNQNVTVNTIPTVSITGLGATYCVSGANVTLTGSPAGGTFSGTGVTGNTFSPSSAGISTHNITYTYTDGNSCTNSTVQSVDVIASPTASIAGLNTSYCINDASVAVIGNPNGGTFSGNGMSGSTFNPASAGVGTHMIIYDFNAGGGCADTDTFMVTVNNIPTVSFSGFNGTYCTSDPIATLVGSPTGGTFSGTGITGNDFDPAAAGTGSFNITYSYTDGNGCSNSTMQSTTILQGPTAAISGLNTGYCETDADVTFTTSPAGGVITGTGVTGNVFSPSAAGAGTHTIAYTFTAGNGCIAIDSVVINVTTAAAAVANFTTSVSGMTATFTNTSTNTSGWSWTFGDGGTDNIEHPSHTYTSFGGYNVCLTAVNACGNTDQFCFDIVIVDTTTGPGAIADLYNEAITVFPNPTNGELNIEINLDGNHTISYQMFDIVGRAIKNSNAVNGENYSTTLDMRDMQTGVYFLRLTIDGEMTIKKVVLEK